MKNQNENKLHKLFELITEIYGWIQIMLSPTLIGVIIGTVVYLKYPGISGKIAGICIGIIGIIIGIVWATKVFKSQKGTIGFMSKVMATPELDKKEVDEQE